jgi:hypothetical protein
VVDLLEGAGDHHMRVSWPLQPDLEVDSTPCGHVVSTDGTPILSIAYASAAGAVSLDQVRGDRTTDLGWWSDHLEARVPSWLVSAFQRGPAPLAMATILSPDVSVSNLRLQLGRHAIEVTWTDGDGPRRVVVDRSRPGNVIVGEVSPHDSLDH